MRRRSLWSVLAVAFLSIGCSGPSLETSATTTTLPDSDSARCDRIGSRVINEFVASFNNGGIDLDPYFATGDDFQWYSDEQRSGIRPFPALYDPWDRSTLIAYLNEARRTQGPMTIRRLKFTSFRQFDQATGFAMELDWGGYQRLGKANVHCGLGQINVWSLGTANP
ncbi:MAG: hypothetical protein WC864_05175 [Ilumatobacteraceae bacterium]